jgi:Leucine-rich repeat (LRR) protein
LDELFLNENQIMDVPPEIANLKNLNKLYLIGEKGLQTKCSR